ncbi:ABC transporter ATP-binding protein [Arenibaculum pallidiluteum]|uniref:ABC transporter ATP-binding protein n=1 Tax=Arenibaculum pallidiluteum TaxID=2812559 RepID=UPI001A97AB0D|nr:ABC transporter ATP-binding protein [Arenibaculum pallidiluteum]
MKQGPDAVRRGSMLTLYAALWRYAAGSRHLVVAFFAMLALAQAARLLVPYFFGSAVNHLQDTRAQDIAGAATALGLMLAAGVGAWLLHGPGRVLERFTSLRIRERFADTVYGKLMRLPMQWHETHHSGETISRVGKANAALSGFSQNQYTYLQNAVGLFGPLGALALISLPVAGAAVLAYALVGLVVLRLDRTMARLIEAENRAERRYAAEMVDGLGNVGTVLTLRLGDAMRGALAARLHEVFAPLRRNIVVNEAKWCTIELLGQVLRVLLVGFYGWLAWRQDGLILVGTAVMVHQYAQQIGDVVGALANQWQDMVRNGTDLAGADEILEAQERRGAAVAAPAAWREIRVEGLAFRHPNGRGTAPTLDAVDFAIRRGERVALVGESGSGKSSLMRVLAGLYEADRASFRVDGQPVEGLSDLAAVTTLIPQDPEIFENTLAYNLTMGLEHSEEEVLRAAELACLTPVLSMMPAGLRTPVVERGGNLSGGQKQRLALARGILAARRSSILMLDEPTSSLDPGTEAQVYDNLMADFPDAAIVSSIHRLHLLPRFDRIVLMEKGRILDQGTLRELLQRQEGFRTLWRKAAGAETAQGEAANAA